ncbi:hypothetical protein MMC11_005093 [Xylographa trunciseda]|nr:hypothetical protein [Xylographa trunciseda]
MNSPTASMTGGDAKDSVAVAIEGATMRPPLEPVLYSKSFFSKELRQSRRRLFCSLFVPLLYETLTIWGTASLYYGSTTSTSLSRLTVYAVDLDGASLGQQMTGAIRASLDSTANPLGWQFDDSVNSDARSRELVTDEQAWAVIQGKLNANASASLDSALRFGNAAYNPLSAMTIYFASARNQMAIGSLVLPAVLGVVNPLLAEFGAQHTGAFLGANAGNATAVENALQCRGCLASPFAAQQVDLHPFDVSTAAGSVTVGLIFLLTFTFSIFQILRANAELIGADLNLASTLLFRFVSSITAYLFLSLSYTLINLAFGVPLNRVFGRSGFVIYWMLNACTMGALGLPMESLFTLIGLRWAGYFLSFWVIINVSSAFAAFEIMPTFYEYGYGFPFFNSIQGARSIIFGTKNHLGRNFGILIAWMVLGLVGIVVFTALGMRENRKRHAHVIR